MESILSDRLLQAEMPPLDAGPPEIAKIKQEIADDLAPFDALHVLSCLAVTQMFTRPEIYSELDQDPGVTIEYVASGLLERSSPALPVRSRSRPR